MSLPVLLILDGNPALAAPFTELLCNEGFEIFTARGEKEALQIIGRATVAVILIPAKLRDMDGLTLLRILTHKSLDTRIILVDTHPTAESTREALLSGAYDHIVWPVTDTAAVVATIHRAAHEFTLILRNRELLRQVQAEASKKELSPASYPSVDRRMQELDVLRAISTDLSALMDVPRILHSINNNLPLLFKYTLMAVIVEVDGNWQTFILPKCSPDAAFVDACLANLLTLHGLFTGRPFTRQDVKIYQSGESFSSLGQNSGAPDTGTELRSNISFPMVAGGETIGCISLCSTKDNVFSAVDVQVFSLITYQLASAVYNANLFHRTQKLSITDHLTGLYNRRHFDELLDYEYFRAYRYKHSLSIAIIDIDYFKRVNDTLGHPSGDLVLQQLGNLLRQETREVDVIARYGGEEFVLLLPETDIEQSAVFAERLRLSVQGQSFVTSQHKVNMTISVGVASLDEEDVRTKEILVHRADEALLVAKNEGRNRVCLYSPCSGVVNVDKQGAREHRRFPRIPLRLPVRYVPISENEMATLFGTSHDLSVEGIAFEAKEALPHGSFVLLDLTLPIEDKEERVRTLARVVWSRDGQSGGQQPAMGVRLMPLSLESRNQIAKVVEKQWKDLEKEK